jgi:hypothetical protein
MTIAFDYRIAETRSRYQKGIKRRFVTPQRGQKSEISGESRLSVKNVPNGQLQGLGPRKQKSEDSGQMSAAAKEKP